MSEEGTSRQALYSRSKQLILSLYLPSKLKIIQSRSCNHAAHVLLEQHIDAMVGTFEL